jgi:hypothetical protein
MMQDAAGSVKMKIGTHRKKNLLALLRALIQTLVVTFRLRLRQPLRQLAQQG